MQIFLVLALHLSLLLKEYRHNKALPLKAKNPSQAVLPNTSSSHKTPPLLSDIYLVAV